MAGSATAHATETVLAWMREPGVGNSTNTIPTFNRMTIQAVRAKRRAMPTRITMAIETGSGRARELSILVAGLAGNACVPSN